MRLTGPVFQGPIVPIVGGVSKTGDEEIDGSYDFVPMFLKGAYFIPKALYRNSGQFSR
jgi:hypothetical protein